MPRRIAPSITTAAIVVQASRLPFWAGGTPTPQYQRPRLSRGFGSKRNAALMSSQHRITQTEKCKDFTAKELSAQACGFA
jgi:hypothetical protein